MSAEEQALKIARGMDWMDFTDHGAASCVASHGCAGVTQVDLLEFARRLRAEWMARLERVEAELRGKGDRAYCDYIGQMKRDTCLGVEYKLKHGTFNQDNLDAFMRAAELLGRHKAFYEAIRALAAAGGQESAHKALEGGELPQTLKKQAG